MGRGFESLWARWKIYQYLATIRRLAERDGICYNKLSREACQRLLLWWVWRSWLARQIVALEAEGSSPSIHLLPRLV